MPTGGYSPPPKAFSGPYLPPDLGKCKLYAGIKKRFDFCKRSECAFAQKVRSLQKARAVRVIDASYTKEFFNKNNFL